MAWSDWAVIDLYGHRYAAAGWMLFVLLVGSWLAVLSSLNEATVFGRGKPKSVSVANVIRFAVMATALPAGFAVAGLPGALLALLASELARYLALLAAQVRLRTTFLAQDLVLTLGLLALLAIWMLIRLGLGLGMPWAAMG
jgi:O-antigen/teichoic acid export membrane protein